MSYRTPTTAASRATSEKGSATRALSLKNELEERQALEKANFELKMKVIQLEEALSKSSKIDAFKTSSDTSEMVALRQQLESKSNELEQKNLLIAKAKKALEALETLKSQALQLRSEEAEHKQIRRELEERIIALSTNESTVTEEFKKRFHALEVQFSSLKAQNAEYSLTVKALEVDKSELEERCSKYAMKIKELEESHSFLEFEKKASDREIAEARSHAAKLKDELNHTKEHVVMYENQLRDFTEELDRLKAVEKDRNKTIEELFSNQRHSSNLKETHDSHVLKLHEMHSTKLEELQERHREELERAKAAAEHHSIREHHEVKTELHSKLYEKHSALEVATHKYEHAATQLELMTSESKQKEKLIQELQAQIFKREEELRQAVVLQEKISKDYSEAASVLQRVQTEKSQLESRYEEVSDAFETARDNLREMKNYANSLDSDSKMYVKELEHHRVKVSAVEDLTRENERFKLLLSNTTKDLSEAQAKLDSCTRDNVHLLEELKRSKSKEELLSSKLIDSEGLQNALTASKESCDEALKYERNRAANAETAAEGLRNSISSLKLDFEKLQQSLSLEQQKSHDSQSRHSDVTQNLSGVCTSLLEACNTWDSTLTIVLEGNSATSHYGDVDLSRSNHSGGAVHGIDAILSMSSFDLIRKVSVQTERISLKVERLTKLRKSFDSFVSKAISSVSEKLQNAQDKVNIVTKRKVFIDNLSNTYILQLLDRSNVPSSC
jgi:chromosome segregation ATPase